MIWSRYSRGVCPSTSGCYYFTTSGIHLPVIHLSLVYWGDGFYKLLMAITKAITLGYRFQGARYVVCAAPPHRFWGPERLVPSQFCLVGKFPFTQGSARQVTCVWEPGAPEAQGPHVEQLNRIRLLEPSEVFRHNQHRSFMRRTTSGLPNLELPAIQFPITSSCCCHRLPCFITIICLIIIITITTATMGLQKWAVYCTWRSTLLNPLSPVCLN